MSLDNMNPFLIWLAGLLFGVSAWQLEIVHLRLRHDEDYLLPFHLLNKPEWRRQYDKWGDFWMLWIILSFALAVLQIN